MLTPRRIGAAIASHCCVAYTLLITQADRSVVPSYRYTDSSYGWFVARLHSATGDGATTIELSSDNSGSTCTPTCSSAPASATRTTTHPRCSRATFTCSQDGAVQKSST